MAAATSKRLRTTILVAVLLALGVGVSSASAAFLPGCANPADSALSQYCETVPSPTGGQRPQGGQTGLGTTLPAQLVALAGGAGHVSLAGHAGTSDKRSAPVSARRRLLTLPAPGERHSLSDASLSGAAASTSVLSLAPGLVAALVALALALTAVAGTRRLRQRPPADAD